MIKKELINQIIDYILLHCDEELTVKGIADYFHYSEYYFCRSFKAATGESVYQFMKRLKMDQSAIDIKLKRDQSITDIGLNYGYSPSNYSTAFKKHHHLSPARFRNSLSTANKPNPFYPKAVSSFETFADYDKKIEIKDLEDCVVIYERMIGNYIELKERWFSFLERYREFILPETQLIERFYDDPAITELSSCICDICITTDESCKLENVTTMKGGRFAVYRFEGKIEDIFCALQGIFSVWLPDSGYEMDQRYGLNIYRSIDRENEQVSMDLCIPVK